MRFPRGLGNYERELAIPEAYGLWSGDCSEWRQEVGIDQNLECELCEKSGAEEVNECAKYRRCKTRWEEGGEWLKMCMQEVCREGRGKAELG